MSNKFSYVYTTQEGIKKTINADVAPTTNIKSFSQESNGFYTITLDFYDADIVLQKCIEIFPVVTYLPFVLSLSPEMEKNSVILYQKLKKDYVDENKIPPIDDAVLVLYNTYIMESKKSYTFKTEDNRYFMCLQFVQTQEDADKMINKFMYCYFTIEELKSLLTKALQQYENISKFGAFIQPYLVSKRENTTIKVSPYDPNNTTIKLFGKFFNASETVVNKLKTTTAATAATAATTESTEKDLDTESVDSVDSTDETKRDNIKTVVIAILILLVCIGLYYCFTQNKKKSPEVK